MEKALDNKYYVIVFCFLLSIAAHYFFPASLEAYERFFSVLVSGTYTDFAVKDYDTDVHFLLFSVYAFINKLFPKIQVYGYTIIGYNILSLTLFGYVLYKILRERFSILLVTITFPIIFLIISSFQIVNLSSTRIVMISCASLFYMIHNNRLNNKMSNLMLVIIFLILSLIRIDAALLASIIFLLISIFVKKVKIQQILPFLISLSVFISFNILISTSHREDKKVYYYRELDLLDRNNIDYNNLSQKDSLYVALLSNHSIMDTKHFEMNYVNKVLKTKSSSFFNSLVNLKLFENTLRNSLPYIFYSKWLILLCLLLIVSCILYLKPKLKYVVLLIVLFFIPFLTCLYITLPLRFIQPFYILYSILLSSLFLGKKGYLITVIMLMVLSVYNVKTFKEKYKLDNEVFLTYYNYIQRNNSINNPIVIEGIETGTFFSPDPLLNLFKTNTLFLNLEFFNSYECYKSSWRNICKCNPLSIIEKLEYISTNKILFISSDEKISVYKEVIKMYWNRNIEFVKIEPIHDNISSYKIIF